MISAGDSSFNLQPAARNPFELQAVDYVMVWINRPSDSERLSCAAISTILRHGRERGKGLSTIT
eukprot:800556-Amorphochlora_amoeboformis.AAC.2